MPATTFDVLDTTLESIRDKVVASERLSAADGLALYRTRDIFTLGALANLVRERRHGRRAYFNINRHINYSNYCVLRCKFCSFYREYNAKGPGPTDAYELDLEQVVSQAAQAHTRGATEVHIVGGLHPKLPFSFYTDMCRAIRERCPGLHIKAFTAIEIVHFTRITKPRLSIREVLIALREAGLGSLPGGGAEIFDDRVHGEAFRNKVGEAHWFDVHRTAHELGIPSNATMLYGHIESVEERVGHMIKLRDVQDESLARIAAWNAISTTKAQRHQEVLDQSAAHGDSAAISSPPHPLTSSPPHPLTSSPPHAAPASRPSSAAADHSRTDDAAPAPRPAAFQCFIPLSFIPTGSEFAHLPGPSGLDDLRTLAVSRLMLDNFDHIKAFWIMQSPKISQVALDWGVDDFDGTVVWYDITKREGDGTTHQEMTVETICRLMREARCEPVERDTLYREVVRQARASGVGT